MQEIHLIQVQHKLKLEAIKDLYLQQSQASSLLLQMLKKYSKLKHTFSSNSNNSNHKNHLCLRSNNSVKIFGRKTRHQVLHLDREIMMLLIYFNEEFLLKHELLEVYNQVVKSNFQKCLTIHLTQAHQWQNKIVLESKNKRD